MTERPCVDRLLSWLSGVLPVARILDAGCGGGELVASLGKSGFESVGIDARALVVRNARARHAGARIELGDVEAEVGDLGMFDLVTCVELVEHLESPVRALQRLAGLSSAGVFIAGWLLDTEEPVLRLVEEPWTEHLALRGVACVPSEASVLEALRLCGFGALYRRQCHEPHGTPAPGRTWSEILALRAPLPEPEARTNGAFSTGARLARNRARGDVRAWTRSVRERLPSWVAVPRRLPFGGWWLDGNDAVSRHTRAQLARQGEWHVLAALVASGDVVVDARSRGGFYAVLFGRRTGPDGLVLAFEPFGPEAGRLRLHLRINGLRHVSVEDALISDEVGEIVHAFGFEHENDAGELNLVAPRRAARRSRVAATTIDEIVKRRALRRLDLVRLDLNGAELAALAGARATLARFRPVLFCEGHDRLTVVHGYRVRQLRAFMTSLHYEWFHVTPEGKLLAAPAKHRYNEVLLAFPSERLEALTALMESGTRPYASDTELREPGHLRV